MYCTQKDRSKDVTNRNGMKLQWRHQTFGRWIFSVRIPGSEDEIFDYLTGGWQELVAQKLSCTELLRYYLIYIFYHFVVWFSRSLGALRSSGSLGTCFWEDPRILSHQKHYWSFDLGHAVESNWIFQRPFIIHGQDLCYDVLPKIPLNRGNRESRVLPDFLNQNVACDGCQTIGTSAKVEQLLSWHSTIHT